MALHYSTLHAAALFFLLISWAPPFTNKARQRVKHSSINSLGVWLGRLSHWRSLNWDKIIHRSAVIFDQRVYISISCLSKHSQEAERRINNLGKVEEACNRLQLNTHTHSEWVNTTSGYCRIGLKLLCWTFIIWKKKSRAGLEMYSLPGAESEFMHVY